MIEWKLAEAKNKLSEVVTRAIDEGPQRITRRDDVVIVLAEEEYERLIGKTKSFKEHLLSGPDLSDLDLTRTKDYMREVDW